MSDMASPPAPAPTPSPPRPLRVVSVSLGSSKTDFSEEVEMLGQQVSLERIGVDGDYDRACALIAELDGVVDAIGLGGTDLYLVAGSRQYVIAESRRLAQSAKVTPVVDGTGLKHTLERETIRRLALRDDFRLRQRRVLVVSAVDRFGMAEAFVEAGCETWFGDLIFGLGVPVPIKTLRSLRVLAALLLPVLCRLPVKLFYPTGEAQERIVPKHARFYEWAEVVAGDFKLIRRNLPERIDGKVIITNTTTAKDMVLLRERGASYLVTTTPAYRGRSPGTNVMEAALVALAGKPVHSMTPEDYAGMLARLGWEPRVVELGAT